MAIVVWIFFVALGGLLLWEAAFRVRQWWRRGTGQEADTSAGTDRYYAPEAETRRELDAAASRAAHSAEAGMNKRAEPRRTL